jgi:DNA-binding response OmpR family regulator
MSKVPHTIFIADDDPALLRGLNIALQGHGYAVRTAEDGAAILSMLEVERPDLLLLDVMMPGMSGLEVLRRIRGDDRWSDLPVVMVTAVPDEVARAGAGSGVDAEVVPKPFRLAELLRRIEARLTGGAGGDSVRGE